MSTDDESVHETEAPTDEGPGARRVVADSIRKAFVNGLSAVLMTEEGIRQVVSDLRLPKESAKDAIGYLTQQAERSRREVIRIVGSEVKHFLESTDMAGLLRSSLSGMKLEVSAQLKFTEDSVAGEGQVDAPRTRENDSAN